MGACWFAGQDMPRPGCLPRQPFPTQLEEGHGGDSIHAQHVKMMSKDPMRILSKVARSS